MLLTRHLPTTLTRTTCGYAAVWLAALLFWRAGEWLPWWLLAAVFTMSAPLGITWLMWLRRERPGDRFALAVLASALYPVWLHLSVFWADALELTEIAGGLTAIGLGGLFFLGLAWVVWGVERVARQLELSRRDRRSRNATQGVPYSAPQERHIWNPLHPAAWYYGRGNQKLKQSTLALLSYASAFWLALIVVSQLGGCTESFERPAGGGQQKTIAQTVRIQKIIRKKFVVNPYSAIKFEVPPIDEVKLQLQEVTAHEYTIGYGEGTGAGLAGGTRKGKARFIRLEYDGGDWDLNYGPGGDLNMLVEFHARTKWKVAERTESRRISQLASFSREQNQPLVFLTGQRNLSATSADVKAIREYLLDKHGMLFASSGSGHFHNQFLALMNRVLPEIRPVPIPLDDTIHRVPFAVPFLPYVVPHGGKEALGWSQDGRWLVYYHPGDISDAWADGHAGVSPEVYEACYQLGANVMNYAYVEYDKWAEGQRRSK